MKCPKCQFENKEDAGFCLECGAKLETPCPDCGRILPLTARFCDKCGFDLRKPAEAPPPMDYSQPQSYTPKYLAEKILTTRSAIEGERKLVTVLFADVANYTSISEKLDPEEVHQIMDGCFKVLNSDGKLDLVIAQGGWNDFNQWKYDAVYHWENVGTPPECPQRFVYQENAIPLTALHHRFVTRGVAAGDLDGDDCPDLVFAHQFGMRDILPSWGEVPIFGALQWFRNLPLDPGPGCQGKFEFPFMGPEEGWLDPGSGLRQYRDVALIKYTGTPQRLPDIIAAEANVIHIFRNYGGDYPNETPGTFVLDSGEWAEKQLDLGGGQMEDIGTEPSLTRFVPMNFDNVPTGEKNDFFVAVQGLRDLNYVLRSTNAGNETRQFELIEIADEQSGVSTWNAAIYDFDGDDYDDIMTFNIDAQHARVLLNNKSPEQSPHFDEVTDEFFLSEGPWRYDNVDGPYSGAIVDLFFGSQHDEPEILIGCDGQNRFLLPETYLSKAVTSSPPSFRDTSSADFLMASGLVGLLPPELAVFLCPDWLPALPELASMLE